jgi:hypothetical protein
MLGSLGVPKESPQGAGCGCVDSDRLGKVNQSAELNNKATRAKKALQSGIGIGHAIE